MGKIICPLCPKVLDSEFEFRLHWQHNHRGPMPMQKVDVAKLVEGYKANAPEDLEIANEGIESGPEYALATSKEGLGELDSVKVDKYGNIIDGFHRTGESANWRREVLDWIDTPEKLELARLAINFARRKVTDQELTDRLTVLIKSGLKPEEIAKTTGINIRRIYRHIPADLKNPAKVAARLGIKEKSDDNCQHTVTIPESIPATTGDLTHLTPRVRTFAEAALEASQASKPKPIDFCVEEAEEDEVVPEGTPLCPFCHASMNLDEFEQNKKEAIAKYGKPIQTLLFPEAS